VLVTLRSGQPALVAQVFGIAAVVLGLDYLAMLGAERILSTPKVPPGARHCRTVLSVLQVALGRASHARRAPPPRRPRLGQPLTFPDDPAAAANR
jgi:hypothetical protein